MSRIPSKKVELRIVKAEDLTVFYRHQCEPEANAMAAFPARKPDAFETHWQKILADKNVTIRTIVVEGETVGNALSWPSHGKRFVGYWLGKDHWGRGIATQALAKFVEVVTERPLYAHVVKANIASRRVLEKCGFVISADATISLGDPTDGVDGFVLVLDGPA